VNILGDAVTRIPIPSTGLSSSPGFTNFQQTLQIANNRLITKIEVWRGFNSLLWYGIKLTLDDETTLEHGIKES